MACEAQLGDEDDTSDDEPDLDEAATGCVALVACCFSCFSLLLDRPLFTTMPCDDGT